MAKFEVIDHFFMFSIFQKFKPTFVLLGQFTWFLMAEIEKNWKDICGKPVKTTNTRILDRTVVVCRVDASDIRDPRFETSHWQCCCFISTVQKRQK